MIRICFRYNDDYPASRIICAIRGGDTAHVEVAHRWVGEVHECVSSSFMDGGVRGKTITMPASKWRIYEIPGDPEKVRQWLAEHDHETYGYLRLVRFVFAPVRWQVGGPVCSHVGAIHMMLDEPWLFDPRALEAACVMLVRLTLATRIQ